MPYWGLPASHTCLALVLLLLCSGTALLLTLMPGHFIQAYQHDAQGTLRTSPSSSLIRRHAQFGHKSQLLVQLWASTATTSDPADHGRGVSDRQPQAGPPTAATAVPGWLCLVLPLAAMLMLLVRLRPSARYAALATLGEMEQKPNSEVEDDLDADFWTDLLSHDADGPSLAQPVQYASTERWPGEADDMALWKFSDGEVGAASWAPSVAEPWDGGGFHPVPLRQRRRGRGKGKGGGRGEGKGKGKGKGQTSLLVLHEEAENGARAEGSERGWGKGKGPERVRFGTFGKKYAVDIRSDTPVQMLALPRGLEEEPVEHGAGAERRGDPIIDLDLDRANKPGSEKPPADPPADTAEPLADTAKPPADTAGPPADTAAHGDEGAPEVSAALADLPYTRHLGLSGPVGSTQTPRPLPPILNAEPPAEDPNVSETDAERENSTGSRAAGRVGFGVNGPYGPKGEQSTVDYRELTRMEYGKGKGLYGKALELFAEEADEGASGPAATGPTLAQLSALLGGDGDKVISNLTGLLGSGRVTRKVLSTETLDFDEVFGDDLSVPLTDYSADPRDETWTGAGDVPPLALPDRPAPGVRRAGARVTGHCSRWVPNRGYGFLETADRELTNIFCHHTALLKDGEQVLGDGEKVEFDVAESKDGRLVASNVRSLGGGYVTSMWELPEWSGSSWQPSRPNLAGDEDLYGYNPWEASPGRRSPAALAAAASDPARLLPPAGVTFGSGKHVPVFAPTGRLPPAPPQRQLPLPGGPPAGLLALPGYAGGRGRPAGHGAEWAESPQDSRGAWAPTPRHEYGPPLDGSGSDWGAAGGNGEPAWPRSDAGWGSAPSADPNPNPATAWHPRDPRWG